MHKCRNVGCNESFKWRMQLCRHETKCSLPGRAKSEAVIESENGYQCSKCGRTYKYKENVYRHFKICKQKSTQGRRDYACRKCGRPFFSKEVLDSHLMLCNGEGLKQNLFVDTSNQQNVMLVIPVDENLMPAENNPHDPSSYPIEIPKPSLYPHPPTFAPVYYPTVCMPNSLEGGHVMPSTYPSIPTTSPIVNSYPVDIKTVKRRTCGNCQRQFVRYDHFHRHVKKCGKLRKLTLEEIQQSLTCSKCNRQYQRKDHFERHTKKCTGVTTSLSYSEKKQYLGDKYLSDDRPSFVLNNTYERTFKPETENSCVELDSGPLMSINEMFSPQKPTISSLLPDQRKKPDTRDLVCEPRVEIIDLFDEDKTKKIQILSPQGLRKEMPASIKSKRSFSDVETNFSYRSSWEKVFMPFCSKVTIINNGTSCHENETNNLKNHSSTKTTCNIDLGQSSRPVVDGILKKFDTRNEGSYSLSSNSQVGNCSQDSLKKERSVTQLPHDQDNSCSLNSLPDDFSQTISHAVLAYLKKLQENDMQQFLKFRNEVFKDQLGDSNFVRLLNEKLQ